jgi:hypothetical protein
MTPCITFDMPETRLVLAGLRLSIEGPPDRLALVSSDRYRDFHGEFDNPDVRITIGEDLDPDSAELPRGEDMVFDSGTVWSMYGRGGETSILLRSPVEDGKPYRLAVFGEGYREGLVRTVRGSAASEDPDGYDPLEFPLSEVMMVSILSLGAGLMVHACGIEFEGRGLLFAGNSTHGKSTMAGLWKGSARVLNDDRIVLRRDGGGFRMYGTPWHGEIREVSAEGTELDAVYFLRHGTTNALEPVRGARAVSMLLARSFLPLWSMEGMEFTLGFCGSVADAVPVRTLTFLPDPSVLELLR